MRALWESLSSSEVLPSLGAPWVSLGSSGIVGFSQVHPVGRWVRDGSLGSLVCALGVVGFSQVHPVGH